jgi:soluble lytic murein transglycosylase-like protein
MEISSWILLIASAADQSSAIDAQRAAADRQREQTQAAMNASIRKQIGSVRGTPLAEPAFFITDSSFPAVAVEEGSADCDPLPMVRIQGLAQNAARANRIDPNLVLAVMRQESGYRPCAVSAKGAMGLMQLMPETASDLGVNDAFDPQENVSAGARLLRNLLDRYGGDLNRVLGAYSAGPTLVDEFDGVPPFAETIHYVDAIMRSIEGFPVWR